MSVARLGLLALLLAGCPLQNKAATDAYARQVMTATTRVASLEAELAESQARLAQLEESMRAQGAETVTRLETIEEVNVEVSRIRGQMEVFGFELAEIQRTLDELTLDHERRFLHAERRLGQVETFLGVEPPPPPTDEELGIVAVDPEGATEGEPGDVEPEPEPTPEQVEAMEMPVTLEGKLELAAEHMKEGRNAVARAILLKSAKEHPGEEGIDEVHYRIAETYFNEEAWSKAISEFNVVIEGWPRSDWASWAMLAQGDAFRRWGQPDNARLFYEEVVRVYPRSDAAKEAKDQLAD